jgi:pyruvate dehydrogenase E1 component alpha subunit
VRPLPGYGGAHLTWKPGMATNYLPPLEYPADAAADTIAKLPKAKLEEIFYKMTLSHQWETMFKDIRLSGEYTYGNFHPRVGEEAIPCTFYSILNQNDYIVSTHAGHHDLVGKGGQPNQMSAEILERKTGYCKGYGGSMHLTNAALGILGMNPIVGANPPLAAGAAWACKVKKLGQVVVSHIGDGAQNGRHWFGAVRSSCNYKLPVIFTQQNNFYSSGGNVWLLTPCPYLADYGAGLGLPCSVTDGNSVAAVYVEAKAAIDRARAGDGPSYIEFLTYRWYDHSSFTGAKVGEEGSFGLPYKTDDEQRAWMSRDPIVRFGTFLVKRNLFTQAEIDALKAKAKKACEDSKAFAVASPLTRPEDGAKNQWLFQESVPATQFFEHKVIL